MKKNSYLSIVLFSFIFFGCASTKQINNSLYKEENLSEDLEFIHSEIIYPLFNTSFLNGAEILNNQISSYTKNKYSSFKYMVQQYYYDEKRDSSDIFKGCEIKSEYSESYEIIEDENYTNVLIFIWGYIKGAAHGNGYTTSFVFNNKTKQMETDICKILNMSLKEISEYCKADLINQFKKMDLDVDYLDSMICAGTDPSYPNNFKDFSVYNDTVTIYFDTYQVCPYALGEQKVVIQRF